MVEAINLEDDEARGLEQRQQQQQQQQEGEL